MSRRRTKLRIAFILTEVSGVCFYRAWQPAMALRKMGHQSVFLWYNHKQFTRPQWEWEIDNPQYAGKIRRDLDMACEWADVVVWMALHTPSSIRFYQEMRLKHSGKPFLLELDDIVFDVPLYNVGSTAYYPGSPLAEIILQQIRNCDGVIVSTPFLGERLGKYHRKIRVIENTIDTTLWRRNISPPRHGANIGWMGGGTHGEDLEIVRGAVDQVLKKYKNIKFTFIHGCPEFLKHKRGCDWMETNDPRYVKSEKCLKCGGLDRVRWTHKFKSIDKYPDWISGFDIDIGLAPLVDNIFNRAKSNLRWLEYSALGIPTVASPVSHFKESIKEGETGLFAGSVDDWVSKISQLVEDVGLRQRIGESALAEVKTVWSPKVQAEKYLRVIEDFSHAEPNKIKPCHVDREACGRSEQPALVC